MCVLVKVTVAADGNPSPTLAWYRGNACDAVDA